MNFAASGKEAWHSLNASVVIVMPSPEVLGQGIVGSVSGETSAALPDVAEWGAAPRFVTPASRCGLLSIARGASGALEVRSLMGWRVAAPQSVSHASGEPTALPGTKPPHATLAAHGLAQSVKPTTSPADGCSPYEAFYATGIMGELVSPTPSVGKAVIV
jgi:hypothetical protein